MTRPLRRLLIAALSLWAARAEAAQVAILGSGTPSPALTETLSRLHGELQSLGIDVAVVERPPNVNDPGPWIERMGAERKLDAIVDVVGEPGHITVDVWGYERNARRWESSRVGLEQGATNAAERLAIRAIETLRARLVEFDRPDEKDKTKELEKEADKKLAKKGDAGPPPPPGLASQGPPPASTDGSEGVDVQAGAVVLAPVGGFGPSLMPLLRAGWNVRPGLMLGGTLAGLGSRPIVRSTAGSAEVDQQYVLVGGSYHGRAGHVVQPCFALSAGALRTALDGQAEAPAQAHALERWALLLEGTVGARVHLSKRWHMTAAAHVQMAVPHLAIHIGDTLVSTTGYPSILFSLTMGTWL